MDKSYLKAFDHPDEVGEFPLGRFANVRHNRVSLGRATSTLPSGAIWC